MIKENRLRDFWQEKVCNAMFDYYHSILIDMIEAGDPSVLDKTYKMSDGTYYDAPRFELAQIRWAEEHKRFPWEIREDEGEQIMTFTIPDPIDVGLAFSIVELEQVFQTSLRSRYDDRLTATIGFDTDIDTLCVYTNAEDLGLDSTMTEELSESFLLAKDLIEEIFGSLEDSGFWNTVEYDGQFTLYVPYANYLFAKSKLNSEETE